MAASICEYCLHGRHAGWSFRNGRLHWSVRWPFINFIWLSKSSFTIDIDWFKHRSWTTYYLIPWCTLNSICFDLRSFQNDDQVHFRAIFIIAWLLAVIQNWAEDFLFCFYTDIGIGNDWMRPGTRCPHFHHFEVLLRNGGCRFLYDYFRLG